MNSLRRLPIKKGVYPTPRSGKKLFEQVRRSACGLCLAILMVVTGSRCNQPFFKNDLEAIQSRGVLKVITRNNGTCYYEGPHGAEGFEYDLVKAFADYLNVRLEILVMENDKAMATSLLNGDADLIAAGFIVSDDLRRHLAFGPIYQQIQQQVVGRRDGTVFKTIADLIGKPIWVTAGGFQEKRLNILKKEYPELSWLSISDYESEELLEMAGQGVIPLTIAESTTIALNQRYHPELTVYFAVDKGQNQAWVRHPHNWHLGRALQQWFELSSTVSLLERLKQHYYGHLQKFDYVDITTFRKRLGHRLPTYRQYFVNAAQKQGLDWTLIAAQSYQESHWNPKAKSFTGVRGMMMLTLETARLVGVKNRLDPRQSIHGGTRYLALLHKKIPVDIPEPDRTFMALAAYNVGLGHLEDAQKLAVALGKDPKAWSDIRATLPLLRLKKYYRGLTHGYARGAEPVSYVDRIRTYHKILTRWALEQSHQETTAAAAEYHPP
ncbi:MAG: membrane-bound lytic murein transglycosylase MltF, partial [Desulfobacterales bacterium]|nr:membrane-bound lytic murein transglycosylase MltF [Desulfobacterales bacterium]